MNLFLAAFLGSLFATVSLNVARRMIAQWMIRRVMRDARASELVRRGAAEVAAKNAAPEVAVTPIQSMGAVCEGCHLVASFPVPPGARFHDAAMTYLSVRMWRYDGEELGWRCPACARSSSGSCIPSHVEAA